MEKQENIYEELKYQVTENYPLVKIEDEVLDFDMEIYDPIKDEVVNKKISDYRWKWLVLFFYPADFTFVCPTELKDLDKRFEEFQNLKDVEIVVASTDTVFSHRSWVNSEWLVKWLHFPMLSDRTTFLSRYFGIMNEDTWNSERWTFIISPDGVLKMIEVHTESVGRSAGELLRKLNALKFVTENPWNACVWSWDGENSPTLKPSIKIAGDVLENLG